MATIVIISSLSLITCRASSRKLLMNGATSPRIRLDVEARQPRIVKDLGVHFEDMLEEDKGQGVGRLAKSKVIGALEQLGVRLVGVLCGRLQSFEGAKRRVSLEG